MAFIESCDINYYTCNGNLCGECPVLGDYHIVCQFFRYACNNEIFCNGELGYVWYHFAHTQVLYISSLNKKQLETDKAPWSVFYKVAAWGPDMTYLFNVVAGWRIRLPAVDSQLVSWIHMVIAIVYFPSLVAFVNFSTSEALWNIISAETHTVPLFITKAWLGILLD